MPASRGCTDGQSSLWRRPASLSPSSGSLPIACATSMRKPSTPRRSQKRSTSCIAASTAGSSQLRSGCSGRNECRYHSPVARVARPRRPLVAEVRDPAVGRRVAVAPDVPRALVAVAPRRATPANHGMLVGGVVRDVVQQHAQPELVRPRDQGVGVVERAEQRIDVGVVGDVVAEVGHRRAVDRRQPDRVGAEVAHVLEALGDAAQVADAVAVGVGEGARIDLVDDGRAPPGRGHRRIVAGRASGSPRTTPASVADTERRSVLWRARGAPSIRFGCARATPRTCAFTIRRRTRDPAPETRRSGAAARSARARRSHRPGARGPRPTGRPRPRAPDRRSG